jgi:N-methylhydantoinase B
LHPKRQQLIGADEGITLSLPGGGGYGNPLERDPELVLHDAQEGLISAERARGEYGVILPEDEKPGTYTVDAEATIRLRAEATSSPRSSS